LSGTNALSILLAALMATIVPPPGQPSQLQPGEYTGAAPSRMVTWQMKRVPPPSPLYVSVDDKLVVAAASSQVNELVTVNYRLLRASDGVIMPGQFTVAPAATRSIVVQQQQLAEGFLLSCSLRATAATTRGQTFARVFLGAGVFGAGQPSYMLMSDYVTTAMAPAHPNGRVLAPSEGPGFIHVFTFAAPPASSDWTVNVPTNARWRFISLSVGLTTVNAGTARSSQLRFTNNGAFFWASNANPPPPVNAGTQCVAGGVCVSNDVVGGMSYWATCPGLTLLGGGTIATSTSNLQVNDQWASQGIEVEEWLDNV
jgi:hypothetical protein